MNVFTYNVIFFADVLSRAWRLHDYLKIQFRE
ncbi:MAG: hypothetical protein ACJAUP_001092 [Cellvibrionaceae bacterium]|jgi:hypothetical protein